MGAVCCTCGDLRPTVLQQAMPLHPCALLSGGRGPQVCPHTRRAVLYTCQRQVWSVSVGLDGVGSCPGWCAGGTLPPGRGWAALLACCTALQLLHVCVGLMHGPHALCCGFGRRVAGVELTSGAWWVEQAPQVLRGRVERPRVPALVWE